MCRTILFIWILWMSPAVFAQSTDGITGRRDTSYSNYSAFEKDVKKFPQIKLVNEFSFKGVSQSRDVVYCQLDGRGLKIDIFYPRLKPAVKRTAVIFIHGGGWRTGNRTQHYPLAQKLASLGYVCFTPEYRLSTEALYPAAANDIKSAIRWVRQHAGEYGIDPGQVVIAGFSAGGELAAFMGSTNGLSSFDHSTVCNTDFSSRVNAVIDIDGILAFIHPESGEGDDSRGTSAATYWFGYSKTENPELWKQGSPLTHVDSLAAPVLFLNSSVERMHAGRSDYIRVLDKYGIYSEVHVFGDAPHSFPLYEPWFTPMVQYIDTFLRKIFHDSKNQP